MLFLIPYTDKHRLFPPSNFDVKSPVQALTTTANIALAHAARSFCGHALPALEAAVALRSCIASLPHAAKGTLIFTKIQALLN